MATAILLPSGSPGRLPRALFLLLLRVLHIKIDMASTVEQLLNPETPPATPAVVRQPFAAKDSILFRN